MLSSSLIPDTKVTNLWIVSRRLGLRRRLLEFLVVFPVVFPVVVPVVLNPWEQIPSQVRDLVLHQGGDLLQTIGQLHLLTRAVLLQSHDHLVVVLVDVLVEFMKSHQTVHL